MRLSIKTSANTNEVSVRTRALMQSSESIQLSVNTNEGNDGIKSIDTMMKSVDGNKHVVGAIVYKYERPLMYNRTPWYIPIDIQLIYSSNNLVNETCRLIPPLKVQVQVQFQIITDILNFSAVP